MKKTVTVVTGLCIITAGIMIYTNITDDVVYVADNTNDTTEEEISPVVQRTLEIYNSSEFQEEMKVMATARAMFELSKEKQQEAIELSEQAMMAYQQSKGMADTWHGSQVASDKAYASSTSN